MTSESIEQAAAIARGIEERADLISKLIATEIQRDRLAPRRDNLSETP